MLGPTQLRIAATAAFLLITAAGTLWCGSAPRLSESPSFNVIDRRNVPLAGARITLRPVEGDGDPITLVTDRDGNADGSSAAAGVYDVGFEYQGQRWGARQHVQGVQMVSLAIDSKASPSSRPVDARSWHRGGHMLERPPHYPSEGVIQEE
jgi:hypothetical protein